MKTLTIFKIKTVRIRKPGARGSSKILKEKFNSRFYHKTNVNKGLNDIMPYIPGYNWLVETVKPVITEIGIGAVGLGVIACVGYVGGVDRMDTAIFATAAVAGHYIKYKKEKSSISSDSDSDESEDVNINDLITSLNNNQNNSNINSLIQLIENNQEIMETTNEFQMTQLVNIADNCSFEKENQVKANIIEFFKTHNLLYNQKRNNLGDEAIKYMLVPTESEINQNFALYMKMIKVENEQGEIIYQDKFDIKYYNDFSNNTNTDSNTNTSTSTEIRVYDETNNSGFNQERNAFWENTMSTLHSNESVSKEDVVSIVNAYNNLRSYYENLNGHYVNTELKTTPLSKFINKYYQKKISFNGHKYSQESQDLQESLNNLSDDLQNAF